MFITKEFSDAVFSGNSMIKLLCKEIYFRFLVETLMASAQWGKWLRGLENFWRQDDIALFCDIRQVDGCIGGLLQVQRGGKLPQIQSQIPDLCKSLPMQ